MITDYERNTGLVMVETFQEHGRDSREVQAVLVATHAPFTLGASAAAAIEHARVLEFLASLECRILAMGGDVARPDDYLIYKHYQRKHGPSKYYGQS